MELNWFCLILSLDSNVKQSLNKILTTNMPYLWSNSIVDTISILWRLIIYFVVHRNRIKWVQELCKLIVKPQADGGQVADSTWWPHSVRMYELTKMRLQLAPKEKKHNALKWRVQIPIEKNYHWPYLLDYLCLYLHTLFCGLEISVTFIFLFTLCLYFVYLLSLIGLDVSFS